MWTLKSDHLHSKCDQSVYLTVQCPGCWILSSLPSRDGSSVLLNLRTWGESISIIPLWIFYCMISGISGFFFFLSGFKYLEDHKSSDIPNVFLVFSGTNILFIKLLYRTIPTSFSDRERKPVRTIAYRFILERKAKRYEGNEGEIGTSTKKIVKVNFRQYGYQEKDFFLTILHPRTPNTFTNCQ